LEDSRLPNLVPRSIAAVLSTFSIAAFSSASVNCPPDVNNNNVVNSDDLLAVVSAWGSCGACPADFLPTGGNGAVNTDEVLAVIGGWGACAACSPANGCLVGTPLWCENFELTNYSRWTGGYGAPTSCESTGFSTERARGGARSHKSRVLCSTTDSHRGYGGLRFQGDLPLTSFLPSTGGIDAPNGVIVTMWSWVESSYTFDSSRWLSLLTVTSDCSNAWNNVVTLNIDDGSMRLKPVHVSSVSYSANAPSFPRNQWNRITVYLNFQTGSMHVWQNGTKVCNASWTPAGSKMCQWHFGLYASGPNSDVTMYEDDYSIVKLAQPMTNFTIEPRFPTLVSPCGIVP
jgi:hypothetical protein